MRLRLCIPAEISGLEEWPAEQQDRLRQVITRAIRKAAAAVEKPDLSIQIATVPENTAYVAEAQRAGARGAPRERLDSERLKRGGNLYGVPSYDKGGEETDLPVAASDEEMQQADLNTPAGDRIVRKEFPRATVIAAQGNDYMFASSNPYVIARNLARAQEWGSNLFGGLGFAIFHKNDDGPDGPFYVAGLTEPLSLTDLGGLGETHTVDGVSFGAVQRTAELVSPQYYSTVMVVTREGRPLVSSRLNARWDPVTVSRTLARVPRAERRVDRQDALEVARALLSAGARKEGDSGELALIVNMDHTIFAAMSWETREHYVRLLVEAWTGEREEIALLEIIRATRNVAELEAIFALLRKEGVYEQLFDDLDGRVYDLLQILSEFSPARALDWKYVAGLLFRSSVGSLVTDDPIRSLKNTAAGLFDWLQSTVAGIWMLLRHPDKAIEGLAHLAELVWTFQKAKDGDPEAVAFVANMVRSAGASTLKAIRGLQYAEQLGSPYGARIENSGIGEDILARLQAALILEILTWFVGIGEVKAAIQGLELPERLAALARALKVLARLGKVGEAGAGAARLERVLLALARAAKIAEEARVLRVVELLPEEHIELLGKMAEAVELPEGAGAVALRTGLHAHPDLLREVDRLSDALDLATRLDARAAQAGGVTAEMAEGFRLLLREAPWQRAEMARLIEEVPIANLEELLQSVRFVRPERLRTLGAQAFRELAEHPRAMAFLREGGDALLEMAFARTGRKWENLESFLDGLALRRDQVGDPAKYQGLLDRLRRGDSRAFEEVSDALHAQRFAEASATGQRAAYGLSRLRPASHPNLLRELAEQERLSAGARAAYASRIAELTDKEIGGLEHIAALEGRAGEIQSRSWTWIDFLEMSSAERHTLLTAVDDIGPVVREGLERALHRCTYDFQGGAGQLLAARSLVRDFGATSLRLEMTTSRQFGRWVWREFDIEADIGGRAVHVEVKTNMQGLTGNPARASTEWNQIRKDLAIHARSNYDDLLYMYHPDVRAQLPGLGQEMLDLFGTTTTPVDAELARLLAAQGVPVATARQAFANWLANGRLTVYNPL